VRASDELVFARGEKQTTEVLMPTADGRLRHFWLKKLLRRPEQPDCLLGFASDITELKDAQAATLRSEARFRTLFEASRDAVVVLRQGRIIDGNQALLDMLGVTSRDALRELHPWDFAPPCSPAARPPKSSPGSTWRAPRAWGISVSSGCSGATTTAPKSPSMSS
jgi:PAS domain-containing protein